MSREKNPIQLKEVLVLKKYEGNVEDGVLLEQITVENGKIVDRKVFAEGVE
jgi:hypothetical protein